MNYDEVIDMANMFRFGSKEAKQTVALTVTGLDNDGLIDLLETSREILFENSGDDNLTLAMGDFVEFIHAEQSSRIITSTFSKIGNFFKK